MTTGQQNQDKKYNSLLKEGPRTEKKKTSASWKTRPPEYSTVTLPTSICNPHISIETASSLVPSPAINKIYDVSV